MKIVFTYMFIFRQIKIIFIRKVLQQVFKQKHQLGNGVLQVFISYLRNIMVTVYICIFPSLRVSTSMADGVFPFGRFGEEKLIEPRLCYQIYDDDEGQEN